MRPVNLLPEQYRPRRGSSDGKRAQLVLVVLGVLVLMVGAYALSTNKVNSKKSDAAKARSQTQELKAQAAALGSYGDFARIKQNRVASVESLANVRFDWERLMREVSRVMPRGTWLSQLNSSVTGDINSSGSTSTTPTTSTSGGAGQPAAELLGCSRRQSDVAKLMVRLRRLYRASDVTLKESGRETDSGTASIDSCGNYVKFDVTVTLGAAPATGEGPGESRKVPASLGGGS